MSKPDLSNIGTTLSLLEDLVDEAILDAALEEHLAQPMVQSSLSPDLPADTALSNGMPISDGEDSGGSNVYPMSQRKPIPATPSVHAGTRGGEVRWAADDGQAPEVHKPDLSPEQPDSLGRLGRVAFGSGTVDVDLLDDGRHVYVELRLPEVPTLLTIQREHLKEETYELRRVGDMRYRVEGLSPPAAEEAYYAARASQSVSFRLG